MNARGPSGSLIAAGEAGADPRGAWRDDLSDVRVAVIGLGYVGLPVAVAFAERFPDTIGVDLLASKVEAVNEGRDPNGEIDAARVAASGLVASSDIDRAAAANVYVVAVPTGVDVDHRPDLRPLRSASEALGTVLAPGDLVIYESTVYPGLTEDECGPILERASGLRVGEDVFLGYSPERLNPGDKEHTLESIVKVVAGGDARTLERVAALYERIVPAGVHRAPSIRVAEAAKVIENTQRDLNIALVNELALIFDRMGIRTKDVLEAAGTKWNFLRFQPGLVGGHCIGVDPYYLTTKAERMGYYPQVILAGRRINDEMGAFIAQKTVKLLLAAGKSPVGAKVTVLGLTFKENVSDVRNSRVPDIVEELRAYGADVSVIDPRASSAEARAVYGIELRDAADVPPADAVVYAVPHPEFRADAHAAVRRAVAADGVLVDVKSDLAPDAVPGVRYWSL
ncbi:MAG: nucleotide sugar dehydrogenase [Trueperaceae bacterium]|nr:nucleotide sugar dehydrogenase [Trueperaceae bacterium]